MKSRDKSPDDMALINLDFKVRIRRDDEETFY